MKNTHKHRAKARGPQNAAVTAQSDNVLRVPVGIRPGDPFDKINKFAMVSYVETLKWLKDNRPSARPILSGMFAKCEHFASEVLRLLNAKSPEQVRALDAAAKATDAILSWIKEGHGEPLSDQDLENRAILLDLFQVPLLNAYMSLTAAQR